MWVNRYCPAGRCHSRTTAAFLASGTVSALHKDDPAACQQRAKSGEPLRVRPLGVGSVLVRLASAHALCPTYGIDPLWFRSKDGSNRNDTDFVVDHLPICPVANYKHRLHTALESLWASVAIEAGAVFDRDRSGVGDLTLETSGLRPADRSRPSDLTLAGWGGGPACEYLIDFACVSSTTPTWGNDPCSSHAGTSFQDNSSQQLLDDVASLEPKLASSLATLRGFEPDILSEATETPTAILSWLVVQPVLKTVGGEPHLLAALLLKLARIVRKEGQYVEQDKLYTLQFLYSQMQLGGCLWRLVASNPSLIVAVCISAHAFDLPRLRQRLRRRRKSSREQHVEDVRNNGTRGYGRIIRVG
eukprot:jgi/Tetstr1/436165/TSEL_025011.t1